MGRVKLQQQQKHTNQQKSTTQNAWEEGDRERTKLIYLWCWNWRPLSMLETQKALKHFLIKIIWKTWRVKNKTKPRKPPILEIVTWRARWMKSKTKYLSPHWNTCNKEEK
jgi:hypothetical protein